MIDPQAEVHETVIVPESSQVWGLARIHPDVRIGEHVTIGEMTYIGRGTIIGDRTRIGAQVHITDHMQVGRGCFIAPMVIFCNDRRPVVNNPSYKRESPFVEDDVSIGVNATIGPGVRLGQGCIIGMGAVVTKDVPPHETWVGNPARRLTTFVRQDEDIQGLQGL